MKRASLLILTTITLVLFSIGDSFGQCNNPVLNLLGDPNSDVCSGGSITIGVGNCMNSSSYDYIWIDETESDTTSTNNTSQKSYDVPANSGTNEITVTYTLFVVTISGQDTVVVGTDDIDVTVLPDANVEIELDPTTPPCEGSAINLIADYTGGSGTASSSNWTNVDSSNLLNATVDDAQSGTQYGVSVTDTEGCQASVSNVTFTINPIPSGFSIVGDVGYCVGDELQLSLSGSSAGLSCSWDKDGTNIETTNCTITDNSVGTGDQGTYSVVVTDDATQCVSEPVSQFVTVSSLNLTINPSVSPTGICESEPGFPLNLSPSPGSLNNVSLTMSPNVPGALNGGQFFPQIAGAGTYEITYSGTLGFCSKSASATIIVLSLPEPIIVSAEPGYCAGEELTLSSSLSGGNFSCSWRKDGTPTTSNNCVLTRDPVQLSDVGNYSVIVTNSATGCASEPAFFDVDVDSLTVLIEPSAAASGICENGGLVELNLTPELGSFPQSSLGYSPTVENALNGEQFSPLIAGDGSYEFTYEVTNGFCSKTETATVIVLPLPVVTISDVAPVCNFNSDLDLNDFVSPLGGIFTLADDSEFSGIFTPVDTTANILLEFNYAYTDPTTNCTRTIQDNIQINPELEVVFEDDLEFCFGTERNLGGFPSGGGGDYSYSWSNGNLIVQGEQNNQFPNLLETIPPGEYNFELTLTDQNNCLVTGVQNLQVEEQPVVTITSDPMVFCAGDALLLTANFTGGVGEPEYFWQNDNSTPNQPNFFETGSILQEQSFAVRISFIDETGCNDASTSPVFVPSPTPDPTLLSATISDESVICDKEVSIYFASNRVPGTELFWSLEGGDQKVDSTRVDDESDDEFFYVYWSDNLTGTETVILEEFLSEQCQAVEQLEVTFTGSSAPPASEIFFSSLNGILYYNQSGLCYRWGYIDPNANLNANPPEPYLNFDLDENTFQSFIIGDLDTTLTYFCQTWLPGNCGDADGSCSSTIVYEPKNNSFAPPPPKEKVGFEVFPNPNTGNFNFKIGDLIESRNYNWELRNPLGQIIDSGDFVPSGADHTESLSIRNQAQGIYLLTISDGSQILKVTRVNIQN